MSILAGKVALVTGGRGIARAVALALSCDVIDSNAVNQAVAATRAELGPIDIVVNKIAR
jgi:NAD(P)-dependent dehydrogenase (short-subunit alcohol dehydrogenase family)